MYSLKVFHITRFIVMNKILSQILTRVIDHLVNFYCEKTFEQQYLQ